MIDDSWKLSKFSVSAGSFVMWSDQLSNNALPTCDADYLTDSSGFMLLLTTPASGPDLLKSVPVTWARIRKDRDWVVPVRGCQSSVSSISLFLLRSLGIKQGMFSILRPCLHTHAAAPQQAWLTESNLTKSLRTR